MVTSMGELYMYFFKLNK